MVALRDWSARGKTFAILLNCMRPNGRRWILAALAGLSFSSSRLPAAGEQHVAAPSIQIVDQDGRIVPPTQAPASGQTFDVTVAPGGSTSFSPSTINIGVGDTVRWTWAAPGHNVRSGTSCSADGQFCSPNNTNCASAPTSGTSAVYTHTFDHSGTYSYFC